MSDVRATEELTARRTPIAKAPAFQEARGLPAFLSPTKARITGTTRVAIDNIKNQFDWDEFLKDEAKYKEAGVDTKAIHEYFGR